MKELGEEGRALLAVANAGERLPRVRKRRIEHELVRRIARERPSSRRRLAARLAFGKMLFSAALVAAGAGGTLLVVSPPRAPAPPPVRHVVSASPARTTTAVPSARSVEPPAAARPPNAPPAVRRRPPVAGISPPAAPTEVGVEDPFATELAALEVAQTALARGEAARALRIAEATSRQGGPLEAELTAARALALCALGRPTEADVVRASFLARWPSSPLRHRLIDRCRNSIPLRGP